MFSNKGIDLLLNTEFCEINKSVTCKRKLIYSGPIDQYFNYSEGKLSYRTNDLVSEIHYLSDYQGASIINFPETCFEYTRIVEPKHFHPERKYNKVTFIQKEFPREDHEGINPLYPVNAESDKEKLTKYHKLVEKENNVIFGGRLGMYRYFDMDDVIDLALKIFEERIKKQ